jgi:6-phosphogluconolactonase
MSAAQLAYPLFIGTYGRTSGAGIYRVTFDPVSGALSETSRVADLARPSFIAYSPDNRFLYALSQSDESVAAFAVDHSIGTLKPLNREPTGFGGSCYVGVDRSGRTVIAISYGDAAVASFPIQADGRLGPRSSLFKHQGQVGPNAARQDRPHAHSATISPDNRFVYVCDLGLDRVVTYRLDAARAELTPAPEADGVSPPGAGPRHSKITADGRFLYVVNELTGSVSVFARDLESGVLTLLETVSTLEDGFSGKNDSSEIRLHPTERFIYVANRGPDTLAVLVRDVRTGLLTRIQTISTGGDHPRNFAVSPDGRWLVCANRDSNNLVVFGIDPASGRLTDGNHRTTVPEPVCVLFPNR